ncbi:E3 ubiquitin-protein ligase RBBP6 isoform X2 [Aethina tumida]|uniref:E3 ubiquitin-protein ligase RBBP6 isoform X2 n=1 Tax=Aethina tumida TaxID=116153 RepID=UPI002147CB14|nr:E3 ubiquitin-protein ligase RBBP6 isoform X2 [Aethina tumida]
MGDNYNYHGMNRQWGWDPSRFHVPPPPSPSTSTSQTPPPSNPPLPPTPARFDVPPPPPPIPVAQPPLPPQPGPSYQYPAPLPPPIPSPEKMNRWSVPPPPPHTPERERYQRPKPQYGSHSSDSDSYQRPQQHQQHQQHHQPHHQQQHPPPQPQQQQHQQQQYQHQQYPQQQQHHQQQQQQYMSPSMPSTSYATSPQYSGGQQQPYNRSYTPSQPRYNYYNNRRYNGDYNGGHGQYKRPASQMDGGNNNNNNNKKKKPPQKPAVKFTQAECTAALDLERHLNVMHKNSLVIKFPDFEITRDMVMRFNPAISSVYFPSSITPRNCFVALHANVDVDDTIKKISAIKPVGANGYLQVERKQAPAPKKESENIDPLTLYVGNLPNDVTKDEILELFPNHRRIDIGYAKKMKYTRYAFISFNTVEDAMNAFECAFNEIMHGKSLIVRFKRMQGTNGQPGEPKQQNPQKAESTTPNSVASSSQAKNGSIQSDEDSMVGDEPPMRIKEEPQDYDYAYSQDDDYEEPPQHDIFKNVRDSFAGVRNQIKEEVIDDKQEQSIDEYTYDSQPETREEPQQSEDSRPNEETPTAPREAPFIRVKMEFTEPDSTEMSMDMNTTPTTPADDVTTPPPNVEVKQEEEDEEEEEGVDSRTLIDLQAQIKRLSSHTQKIRSIRQETNEKKKILKQTPKA